MAEFRKDLLKKAIDKHFRSLEICFNIFLQFFPNRVAKEDEVVKMLAWSLLYYRQYLPCADNLKSWLQTSVIQWRSGDEIFRVLVDCPNEGSHLLFCMWNINTGRCTEVSIEKENLKSCKFQDCRQVLYEIDCAVSKHAKADALPDSHPVDQVDPLIIAENLSNETINYQT